VTAGPNPTWDGWGRAERRVDTLSDIAAEVRRDRWTRPPRTEPEVWLDATPEPELPRRTRDAAGQTVGEAIAGFLEDARRGRALDSGGRPYARESLRELRSSLTHVDSELGSLPLRQIDNRLVDGLLEDLRREGLSRARLDSMVVALRALRVYAGEPQLGDVGALREPTVSEPVFAERPRYAEQARYVDQARYKDQARYDEPQAKPSPTLELLASARRVATWTVRSVVFVFAVLVVFLILEL